MRTCSHYSASFIHAVNVNSFAAITYSIKVSSASVSRFLPNAEVTSREAQPLLGPSERLEHEHQIHLADAKARAVVWTDEDFADLHAEEKQEVITRPEETKTRTGSGMDVDVDVEAQPLRVEESVTQDESGEGGRTPNWEGRPEVARRLASVARRPR